MPGLCNCFKMEDMIEIREITDLALPELDPYTKLNENQLKHYYEPEHGIFIGESRTVVERALAAGYEPLSLLMERRYTGTEGKEILRRLESLSYHVTVIRQILIL